MEETHTAEGGLYRRFIKRTMDIIVSALALIIFSPLFLTVAVLVKIILKSPVIFKQQRPGLNEKIFTLYKFRTMTDKRDESGKLAPDGERLTKFGGFLRSVSLDELPQLLNILKGDMSIVGPRPHLVEDLVFMTSKQRKRHLIRPGLTGLAQINGRNKISWEEKLDFDLTYIYKASFFLDLSIVIKTIFIVIKRSGINADGHATTETLGDYLLKKGAINESIFAEGISQSRDLIKSQ
jgi:lipopolysaccharide/colanic/teichoic acid biosynthesis glycosyltransferase